jgi:hypothetical protein
MSALRSVSLLLIAVLSLASTRVSAYSTSVWWNSQTCAGEPDQYISGQINNNCAQKDGKSVGITCQDTLKITQVRRQHRDGLALNL